jgi:hypothetical protein
VKLEQLDEPTIAELMAFCGLDPAPAVVSRFGEVFDLAKASGRAPLTDAERRQIAPFVEPVNAWLGYTA